MLDIKEILKKGCEMGAADVFLIGGLPLTYKVNGRQCRVNSEKRLMPDELEELIKSLYEQEDRPFDVKGEDDFSFALPGCGRFRANIFRQRGSLSAVIRVIQFGVPSAEEFNIPKNILDLCRFKEGLVLVTGPAGSGKSTTLACIIDEINKNQEKTIVTMEDPIEIIHTHKKSIVIQREVFVDTENFITGLRAALRESPDVVLLGEVRDEETMEVVITAAETGQLIFSSMHTLSSADTVDRIVDTFPEKKQHQVRAQLARVLRCVVCQKLLPTVDGGLVPVFEIMTVTPAIQNLIREGKTYQFNSVISDTDDGTMCSLNTALMKLIKAGKITVETALENTENRSQLERKLKNEGLM